MHIFTISVYDFSLQSQSRYTKTQFPNICTVSETETYRKRDAMLNEYGVTLYCGVCGGLCGCDLHPMGYTHGEH